jgi:serine/threonine protein kinase
VGAVLPGFEPQWAPGTLVGGYEIVEHLATGGMAEVYVAVPVVGGIPVVLKAMSRHLLHNEEFVRLFLDEAQLVATLTHPNIGQIYDRGQHNGVHYFVMEYVIGQSVREFLNRSTGENGIPLSHAIDITCQIAAALHYAHEKRAPDGSLYNIVHRDLSHSNVLVTYDGVVKLIDFGVAKSSLRSTVTSVGSLKGKIRYMSPEQLRGDSIDRRTDVFALGVMFWEMSTGAPLFRAPNDAAVMHKILFEDISRPTEVVPAYPLALENIVMHALAKKLDDRMATAEELGRRLAEFATSSRLPRGGLRVFSRLLFGKEIDQALARVEALQARVPDRRRGRAVSETDATATPPESPPSPIPIKPRTAERPIVVPMPPAPAPALAVRRSTPSIPVRVGTSLPAVSGTVPARPSSRRRNTEKRNLILLGVIVLLVVGGGILLSRYTLDAPASSQSR